MKICNLQILTLLVFSTVTPVSFACSDIFINQVNAHIEARSMDFGVNIADNDIFGFIGQKNITDVIIDADKVPANQLTSWTNKYGYWARPAFNTSKADDGMNTQGLSLSGLYLEDVTKYPIYDPQDKRPVLGVFDMGSYLLSQAKNVDEAIKLIKSHQIVQSAIQVKPGVFLRNVPIHFDLRDSTGNSAVIEFIAGQVKVYEHAGNVMTNGPTYPEQLALAKKYVAINKAQAHSLDGLPGDFTSEARFARGQVLLRNLPQPYSHGEALYQADFVISSLSVPFLATANHGNTSNTIWRILKDLDNKVVYTNNVVYFQGGNKIVPTDITGGYTKIDLNNIDFSAVPQEFENSTIQVTPADQVKKIIRASDLPEFGE